MPKGEKALCGKKSMIAISICLLKSEINGFSI